MTPQEKKLALEKRDKGIMNMYLSGMNLYDMARKLKIHPHTIRGILARQKINVDY